MTRTLGVAVQERVWTRRHGAGDQLHGDGLKLQLAGIEKTANAALTFSPTGSHW